MHVLNYSRTDLYLNRVSEIAGKHLDHIQTITRRCAAHEPFEYITGSGYFFNRSFNVAPGVLIPRPDTESLIEQVLSHEGEDTLFFAEVGIGTGIISCVLTEARPNWSSVGIDTSSAAVAISRENSRSKRMQLLRADALTAFKPETCFDFIVSNPPYIPTGAIAELDISVQRFEPHSALDGGCDGLHFYRYFADTVPAMLASGGRLYCEIGYDQKDVVAQLFTNKSWDSVTFHKDNAGNDRVMVARLCQREETA